MLNKNKPVTPKHEDIEWCTTTNPNVLNPIHEIKISSYINDNTIKKIDHWNDFVREIDKQAQATSSKDKLIIAEIDSQAGDARWKYIINGEMLDSYQLDNLHITQAIHGTLHLRSYMLCDINISQNINTLHIENCKIKRISISANCEIGNLEIRNSVIGNFKIDENSIRDLKIKGGAILGIDAPSPRYDNPFCGRVEIENNVYFQKVAHDNSNILNTASYRHMRYHLAALENFPIANRFHALELSMERKGDSRFNNLLSYAYEWSSSFGNSSLKPIGWLVGLWLVYALVYWWTDMAILSMAHKTYLGWKSIFLESSMLSNIACASMLSFQEVVNPLGIFSSKILVLPARGWGAIAGGFHSLISTVLLALFVFAIRRRFKM